MKLSTTFKKSVLLSLNFCFIALVVQPMNAQVEEHQFVSHRLLEMKNNLQAKQVRGGIRDSLGYYWIVDINGLQRFDGKSFELIKRTDIGEDAIFLRQAYILQDDAGMIWVISVMGKKEHRLYHYSSKYFNIKHVFIFDPYQMKEILFEEYTDSPVSQSEMFSIQESQGQILIASYDGGLYSWTNGEWMQMVLPCQLDPISLASFSSHKKKLFFVSGNQLYQLNGKGVLPVTELPFIPAKMSFLHDLIILHDQYSNDQSQRFYCYALDLGKEKILEEGTLVDNFFWTIDTEANAIWTIDELNLLKYIYDTTSNQLILDYKDNLSIFLPGKWMPTHAEILDGKLWLFANRDICIINKKVYRFITYPALQKYGIREIEEYNDSILLINTFFHGSKLLNRNDGKIIPIFPNEGERKFSILKSNDGYLIGSKSGKIFEYAQLHDTPKEYSVEEPGIHCMIPVKNELGELWGGGNRGILYLDTITSLFKRRFFDGKHGSLLNDRYIYDIIQAEDGYWVTTDMGVFLLDTLARRVLTNRFKDQKIISLHVEDSTGVWLLPKESNPFYWDRKKEVIEILDIYRDKWLNSSLAIIPFMDQCYGIPTDNGFFIYDTVSGRVERLSTEQHSLPNNEFCKWAWKIHADGKISLGGVNGLMTFRPEEVHIIEPTLDERMEIGTKKVIGKNGKNETIYTSNDITNEYNVPATVEYLFMDFYYPMIFSEHMNFYYRLNREKGKGDWLQLLNEQLVLNKLPAGQYNLEIALKGELDQKFQAHKNIMIKVLPPWYLHPLSITSVIFLFIGLGWGINIIRIRWYKAKQVALKNIIRERTAELREDKAIITQQKMTLERMNAAKDRLFGLLGHELRTPLITVMGLCETASRMIEHQDVQSLQRISTHLDKYAKETRDKLDKLIEWGQVVMKLRSAEHVVVNIEKTLHIILDELATEIDEKKIKIEIDMLSLSTMIIDKEAINIILRNLLHNAIKFSYEGGIIKVSFHKIDDYQWQIAVADFGKGLPSDIITNWNDNSFFYSSRGTAGEKGSGLGLQLCHSLAKRNGCQLVYEQERVKGTKISLLKQNG